MPVVFDYGPDWPEEIELKKRLSELDAERDRLVAQLAHIKSIKPRTVVELNGKSYAEPKPKPYVDFSFQKPTP